MKPILSAVLASLILWSCSVSVNYENDCTTETKGNGKAVSVTRPLSSFQAIEIKNQALNITLKQGESEEITLKTDENLIDLIETEVKNNKLFIKVKEGYCFKKKNNMPKLEISFKDLHAIDLDGLASLKGEDLELDSLTLDTDGLGKIDFTGSANYFKIDVDGISKIDTRNFVVKHVVVHADGIGKTTVHATESLEVDLDGIGQVQYRGNPKISSIHNDGISKVKQIR